MIFTRRQALAAAAAGPLLALPPVRTGIAAPASIEAALRDFTGGAEIKPGKVKLDIPALVENGNAVPLTLAVDSPMTAAAHVRAIAIFTERNPQPNVAIFRLGPRAGRAAVSLRMRLATSQKVTAVAALSDGSFWSDAMEVVVTLAACVEN
jgi:sulfur-oxidizing protein SoxY